MLEGIEGQLKKFYANNMAAHGSGAQGVGWKNDEAQRVRFEQLLKLLPTVGDFSVNDLGCGTGAFVDFLASRYPDFVYYGYDVIDEMIHISKENHSSPKHHFQTIQQAAEMRSADYSIASGIFNIRYNMDDSAWRQYILDTLHVMNDKSEKGFAFNALTTYSDPEFMKMELFYSDPLQLFDYCKRNFAKNVALLHDYYQYDFTIIVRKV
jgi:hypothetical protein